MKLMRHNQLSENPFYFKAYIILFYLLLLKRDMYCSKVVNSIFHILISYTKSAT